jgi:hypothetical protein
MSRGPGRVQRAMLSTYCSQSGLRGLLHNCASTFTALNPLNRSIASQLSARCEQCSIRHVDRAVFVRKPASEFYLVNASSVEAC